MKKKTRNLQGLIFFGVATFASIAPSQSLAPPSPVSQTILDPRRLPLPLRGAITALGSRLQMQGNERSALSGTLADSTGSSPAVVMYELPNKFRINLTGGTARTIGFDGSANWASNRTVTEQDEDLLETFVEDSPEGMLNAVLKTASLRVIATHARMEDGQTPIRSVDIYQVVGPVQSSASKAVRQKHYCFDSSTHLLVEVDYVLKRPDASIVGVRVQRSGWTSTGGQSVPGTITRFENGKIVATFTTTSATFSPAATDGTFTAP